ncbi:MAG: PEP/pyruvate-binding domain-containing protein [Syntrophomonadaceae bacterium]|nr:PEP/pyruvate-binding domain-containing protein [Syntrophomonadaceae bacterium]
MNERETANENLLDNLRERAKELNCLYLAEEALNNQRLSLPEVFKEITRVIPSGWQFPEVCKAMIIYENCSYQTVGFIASPWSLSSDIKVGGKAVGKLEVVYTTKVPKSEEGYFLEKERKLIKTVADRIGQTILQRSMEQVIQEWTTSRSSLYESQAAVKEWAIIVDLLSRTDPVQLHHICRKMINHLYLMGVKEAEEVLWEFISGSMGYSDSAELNYPRAKFPLGDLAAISEKTFRIAAMHLSDAEISARIHRWMQEEKAYPLIRAVDRIDASVKEIVQLITRYRNTTADNFMRYSPLEHWLIAALTRRFLSDNIEFINRARQYFTINDFYDIASRLIFPEGSQGKIGGKSTGLFLAQKILEKNHDEQPILQSVKIPKSWYITTDTFRDFIHYNQLEELNLQKYKDLYEIRLDYPNIIQIMKNAEFPQTIVKSLAMALDDFGDVPLIVRSSSILEDQKGAAFSGKYKSLFLANQGSKQQRMEALMDAIVEVYASLYNPDSIQYRSERELLEFQEEMGILIQEVVGTRAGRYFFPLYAGVAFSNNEFLWSSRIKREDGLVRLVMGLGTRAVDRLADDFPMLVSPGQPKLRVNTVPEEVRRYSPKKIDVINLDNNRFETIEISALLKECGESVPRIQQIISVYSRDYIKQPLAFDIDFSRDELIVTFEGLVSDTPFIKQIISIQDLLQEKMGTAVDIEFASDGQDFYLLQCRPQSYGRNHVPAAIPKDIAFNDTIFSAHRSISNGIIQDITHIVYVDPEGYSGLKKREELFAVGKAVGMLNQLLPKQRFVLIGPGRWGSRGDITLGVPVTYADINKTSALIEIARQKSNYVPELSFGTHFFQDLVEANIRYLPLYPDDEGVVFNEAFFNGSENILTSLLPDYAFLQDVVKVIDIPANCEGRMMNIVMNAELEEALAYLTFSSGKGSDFYYEYIDAETTRPVETYADEKYWRWRHYMAERIAARLDMEHFGVQAIYLFGSTNSGNAGPGSDIDLIIHFQGTLKQQEELTLWLEGWSMSLAEMNYLKTGYTSKGLLDVHIVTDEDIAGKTSFASKINAVTEPAYLLKSRY